MTKQEIIYKHMSEEFRGSNGGRFPGYSFRYLSLQSADTAMEEYATAKTHRLLTALQRIADCGWSSTEWRDIAKKALEGEKSDKQTNNQNEKNG